MFSTRWNRWSIQGPAEGLPKEQWRLKSPKEILDLKVCDMAMGSGAFLVQACRYLSERLVESWENLEKAHPGEVLITPEGQFSQGEPSERLIPKEAVERLAIARRLIADRCIYGVDINPMAVEMAKLSIWLITVDKTRPFTFLDHALKCGDSLWGISRFKQLETFSLDDENSKQVIILSNYDELIQTAIKKRRELEMLPSNDAAQIATKAALLKEAEERMERLKLAADVLIAAELTEGNEKKKEMARAAAHLRVTEYVHKSISEFRHFVSGQLAGRRPLHWPIEFPEIFETGGFGAFVGNPPYLGGKRISFRLGDQLFQFLKDSVGHAIATTDLCVFFMLRCANLVRERCTIGLVVSDIVRQGDSRVSGLESLIDRGFSIVDAVSSTHWPGTAGVKISHVHLFKGQWFGKPRLDGNEVVSISSYLRVKNANSGPPLALTANNNLCFTGHYLMGQGFVLSESESSRLIEENPRNTDVLFNYVRGEDVNNEPLLLTGQKVINLGVRNLDECRRLYPECVERIERLVKPERDLVKSKGEREYWWRYARPRPNLEKAAANLSQVLVQPFTAKFVIPCFVPARSVFAHPLVVIADPRPSRFAVLQSTLHLIWVWEYCSTSLDLLRYTASDVLETYPFPADLASLSLNAVGHQYIEHRDSIRQSKLQSVNDIYNRFHDPLEKSADIVRLRELQVTMDQAVVIAYSWGEFDLDHGFHETKQGLRFTIGEHARRIVLDRLLALNHERYEEELSAGLHESKVGSSKRVSHIVGEAAAQGELL
ncbi:MAG: Eco57I restriction-modification methylase domain-containing protein [Terriglobales bacterium]